MGALVVAKLDRLTRSVRDLIRLTELLRKHGVALVSIQEAVDTSTATGQMFYTLVTVISEWERGVIGERTREALAHKRRDGKRAGAIPYGFKLARDRKTLVEVPEEQRTLALIQRKRERLNLSFSRIATDLNARGNLAKHGGRWQPGTIRSVLRTLHRHGGMLGPVRAAG